MMKIKLFPRCGPVATVFLRTEVDPEPEDRLKQRL